MSERCDRRTVIKWMGGTLAVGATGLLGCGSEAHGDGPPKASGGAQAAGSQGWTRGEGAVPSGDPVLVIARNGEPAAMVDAAITALGGMGRFVPSGSKVLVKPNIGWDRGPELGANTNPAVVGRVVELVLAAGASKVTVMDRTCNDARRSYKNSGIEAAASAAGARVVHADEARTTPVDLKGVA